jgi:OmpA-OmpF porin, OOP family
MKFFTLIIFLLIGITQVGMTQERVQASNLNAMSNVVGLTVDGGLTLGRTDYNTNKLNYNGKASLEYFLPSTGASNFGLRVFGQSGFISGKDNPTGVINKTNEFSTEIDLLGGGIIYNLSLGDAVYLQIGVGASNLMFYPKDGDGNKLANYSAGNYSTQMLAYNGDASIRLMLSQKMSLNGGVGIVIGSKDFLDDIKSGSGNDMLFTANVGLSYYFGRDRDSDGDGVPNSRDACPDTPTGVKVDENGCPLDSDGDGIANYLDKCPDTPAGVRVDASGCPLDADGDGVPDYLDKCANTPVGVKVDIAGCPLDADGDGVPDYLDKCANTPAKVAVDVNGCPLDADGDGVPDYLDKCPNTPKGIQVNADGCPIKKEKETVVIVQPAVIKSIVLSGDANFEFNKAILLPNAYTVLDSLASTMKAHNDYEWEIGGYTDGIGSANANKKLSVKRAQAVVDYLTSQGVAKSNLKIVGYGKDNPIATNKTLEGRSMNRRVEIKLLTNNSK